MPADLMADDLMTEDEWRRICQAAGIYFSYPPTPEEREMMRRFEVSKGDPKPTDPADL